MEVSELRDQLVHQGMIDGRDGVDGRNGTDGLRGPPGMVSDAVGEQLKKFKTF